jgi:hypothetical protein
MSGAAVPVPAPSTLLVWEDVPAMVQFYVIPDADITDKQRKALHLAAGCFINDPVHNEADLAANKALNYVMDLLATKLEYCSYDTPSSECCVWPKYLAGGRAPRGTEGGTPKRVSLTGQHITRVYHMGFLS